MTVIQRDLAILFPAHPRTVQRLAELDLAERLANAPGLRIIEPLGYLEFLDLMMHARLVMTDSGRHSGGDDDPRGAVPDSTGKHRAPDHDQPRHKPSGGHQSRTNRRGCPEILSEPRRRGVYRTFGTAMRQSVSWPSCIPSGAGPIVPALDHPSSLGLWQSRAKKRKSPQWIVCRFDAALDGGDDVLRIGLSDKGLSGCPFSLVVVRRRAETAWLHRQPGCVRSRVSICDFSSIEGPSACFGGSTWRLTTSASLATSVGSCESLRGLKEADPGVIVLVLGRETGAAAALASGFKHARGETILTLPAHVQVDPNDIPRVVGALDHCQMAIGRRSVISSTLGQRILAGMFHRVLRILFGHGLSDLVCRVRACRRGVLNEIGIYGFQHHFVPLLAQQQGFAVHEVNVRPGPASVAVRRTPFVYLGILFDILTLYVLLRFTKKPLRFFGSIGMVVLIPGLLFTAGLAIARLLYMSR